MQYIYCFQLLFFGASEYDSVNSFGLIDPEFFYYYFIIIIIIIDVPTIKGLYLTCYHKTNRLPKDAELGIWLVIK